MGRPYVSVVVPSWNEEKYIGRTLRSLRRQSLPRSEYEIIVVDGHSKDGTVRIARRYADKVLLENKGSIGYARNLGAKRARGEVVAFIDADTVAPRDWLKRVLENFKDRRIVGIGGRYFPLRASKGGRKFFRLMNNATELASRAGIYSFIGLNCAYRTREFLAAGGFRPSLKYMEDIEFSARFSRLHRKGCRYCPDVRVRTSERRISQQGVLRHFLYACVGCICLATKADFPWEYAHSLRKSGLRLRPARRGGSGARKNFAEYRRKSGAFIRECAGMIPLMEGTGRFRTGRRPSGRSRTPALKRLKGRVPGMDR